MKIMFPNLNECIQRSPFRGSGKNQTDNGKKERARLRRMGWGGPSNGNLWWGRLVSVITYPITGEPACYLRP